MIFSRINRERNETDKFNLTEENENGYYKIRI